MDKTIMEMKKADFLEVPHAKWNELVENFSSLVIIPTKRKHDSGYMCMEFCAVDENNKPIKRLSGCSDILHIDGIGGYGKWRDQIPTALPPKGWSIDCIPCGYLRIFNERKLSSGVALSSFEIFSE